MEFRGTIRRLAGAGTAVAAAATLLLGGVSGVATAATGQEGVDAAAAPINILHASTRTCLDSNSAGHVYTLQCNGGRNQQWDNYTPGKFRNVGTGRCLAGSNGGSAYTTDLCGNAATNWTTTSGSPKKFTHVLTQFCLHGPGGSPQAAGLASCASATRWSTLAAS